MTESMSMTEITKALRCCANKSETCSECEYQDEYSICVDKLMQDAADTIDRLTAELAELRERFEVSDDLLNQATVTIGAVIACCTYNSNEDAKIGIYGISPDAFTRIDQFIANYNRAVSAGKVSVDVKPVKRDLSDAEIEELGAAEAESRSGK